MLKDEEKQEIKDLLAEHPNPSICIATTIKDGYVSCIKPIPTIRGAELICSPTTRDSLEAFLRTCRSEG